MSVDPRPQVAEWAVRSDLIGPPRGPARCAACGRVALLPWEGAVEAPWGERREVALCVRCAPPAGRASILLPTDREPLAHAA